MLMMTGLAWLRHGSTMRPPCLVLAALLHAVLVSAHPKPYDFKTNRMARGSSGLVPFPRIGRGGNTWEVLPDEYVVTDSEPPRKRPLYAFPRVGRSGSSGDLAHWNELSPQMQLEELETLLLGSRLQDESGSSRSDNNKRNSQTELKTQTENMWFGPRLGRADKDMEYDDESPQKVMAQDQSYAANSEERARRRTH